MAAAATMPARLESPAGVGPVWVDFYVTDLVTGETLGVLQPELW